MTAERVSISQIKARLSELLSRLRAGKTAVVTDRGMPVARIDSVGWPDDPEGQLATLVAAGLARLPERLLGPEFFAAPRPKDPQARVLKALLAERGEGR